MFRATLNSLRIAEKRQLDSIAFPAISTGIFHFPVKRCASTMLKAAADFMMAEMYPRTIIFCLYDPQTFAIFSEELSRLVAAFSGK